MRREDICNISHFTSHILGDNILKMIDMFCSRAEHAGAKTSREGGILKTWKTHVAREDRRIRTTSDKRRARQARTYKTQMRSNVLKHVSKSVQKWGPFLEPPFFPKRFFLENSLIPPRHFQFYTAGAKVSRTRSVFEMVKFRLWLGFSVLYAYELLFFFGAHFWAPFCIDLCLVWMHVLSILTRSCCEYTRARSRFSHVSPLSSLGLGCKL